MAEIHYTIDITNKTSGGGIGGAKRVIAGQNNKSENVQTDSAGESGFSFSDAVKAYIATKKFALPFIEQQTQHAISLVSLQTGNTERQARTQFGYQIARQTVGIADNIAVGGAVGNLPGAITGALIGIGSTIMSYVNKSDTLKQQRKLEDISLGLLNARAGGALWATASASRN